MNDHERKSLHYSNFLSDALLICNYPWTRPNLGSIVLLFIRMFNSSVSHKIQSGTWESTKIQTKAYSSNIKDFIAKWMQSNGSSMTLIDSCVGAHCNPTCPGQFLFADPAAIWKQSVQTTILLISLVITIVSLGFKATFFLQHYHLNRKQKRYLNEFASSPVTREVGKILLDLFLYPALERFSTKAFLLTSM